MNARFTKQILLAVVAVVSLFATAAPACVCGHHERPKEQVSSTPSCHSHMAEAAVDSNFCQSGDCLCVPTEQPAVEKVNPYRVVKAEIAVEAAPVSLTLPQTVTIERSDAPLVRREFSYSTDPPGSLGSRAPPRL